MLVTLPYENQQAIDLGLEDDEDVEAEGHDDIPDENDGQTNIIGNLPYIQTAGGQWRKVDVFGNFYVKTLKTLEHVCLFRCGRSGNDAMQQQEDAGWLR